METVKEKAEVFAKKNVNVNAGPRLNTYIGYVAGYEAAFEWISVETELPDNDRAVLAYNEDDKVIWVSCMENGKIVPHEYNFFGIYYATHWREVELTK